IKQKDGEKVGEYTARFNKLMRKVAPGVNDLHDRFKVNYYIQGLSPMIAGRTFEGGPETLNAAIDRAKNIEAGNNLMLQGFGINNSTTNEIISSKPQNIATGSKIDDEVDSLTKQLEQLKISKLEREILSMKEELNNSRKPQRRQSTQNPTSQ